MPTPLNRPTTNRMIQAVRTSLANIIAQTDDAATMSKLKTIDVILNELGLRENGAALSVFYKMLLEVIDEGLISLNVNQNTFYISAMQIRHNLPAEIDPVWGYSNASPIIDNAMQCLALLMSAAGSSPQGKAAEFVSKALEVENHQLSRMAVNESVHVPARDDLPNAVMFQTYLAAKFTERSLKLKNFQNLVGGYQKITILFDTEDKAGKIESMVLRAEKADQFVAMPASAIKDEFEIVTLVWKYGLPVAEPLWLEIDETKIGRCFMVSKRMKGKNLGSAIQANDVIPDDVVKSFVTVLAKIHTMALPAKLPSCLKPWQKHSSLQSNTRAAVEMWGRQKWTLQASHSAAFTRLNEWLINNVPNEEAAPCLVHVDYGPHNILVNDNAVSAVLDWEAARIGDPAEDLSYLLQSLGAGVDRKSAITWYTQASGNHISEKRLRYFDAFNLQKMIAGPMAAAAMFEQTPDAAIEWCNIPLRWMAFGTAGVANQIALAEAEYDL